MTNDKSVLANPLSFWRIPRVIERTGLPKSTIYAKVKAGQFPAPIKLSKMSSAWSSQAVEAWMQERLTQAKKV